jgi:hypothetical protein
LITLWSERIGFILYFILLLLTACSPSSKTAVTLTPLPVTATSLPTATELPTATAVPPTPKATATAQPTATAVPSPAPTATAVPSRWISALSPVIIYSGLGRDYEAVDTLESGEAVAVLGDSQNNWIPVACPTSEMEGCWTFWDWAVLISYDGLPRTLNIPDPDTLEIVMTETAVSPDGRWQADISRTETIMADEGWVEFFYVELKVTSLSDGTTWIPVSEWHIGGLGEEGAPRVFHWSMNGRYLYYTSTFDLHGAECGLYYNIGDYFNRLDLSDGFVASLPLPQTLGILTIAPDETQIAYVSGPSLFVQDLEMAYKDGTPYQDSVKWQIPLDVVWPVQVSQIVWSPDNQLVLVTATLLGDDCQLASRTTWALDVESGDFTIVPNP